jgi:hypothetical protein
MFTPRRAAALSSCAQRDANSPALVDISLAPGCELIIRGVEASKKGGDTVAIVQKSINEIRDCDPQLANIPLNVRKFSHRDPSSVWFSSCYVFLAKEFNPSSLAGSEAEPRVDLLEMWGMALDSKHPEWEVAWAPTTAGTDKRMWLRFPDLREGLPEVDQPKCIKHILEWADKKKYNVCKHFGGKTGITLQLASPQLVDKLTAEGTIHIPGIPNRVPVTKGKQIEIQHAFELIIRGVPTTKYQGIDNMIVSWLIDNFNDSDGNPTYAGSRAPDNDLDSQSFIFHMTTWEATSRVLSKSSHASFEKAFARFMKDDMMLPATIYETNGAPFQRREKVNLASEFSKGKDSFNESLKSIRQTIAEEIGEVRKEMRNGNETLQAQMTANTNSISALTGSVQQLQESNANIQRAVLAQATEMALSRNLNDIATARMMAYVNWVVETDPEQKLALKGVLNEIQQSEAAMKVKMEEARNNAHLIMGGPPGLSLPPIHSATNSTSPSSSSVPPEPMSPSCHHNNQSAVSPMTIRIPSLKRQRSELTASSSHQPVDMQMDIQEVRNQIQQVRQELFSLSNSITAAHAGPPAPKMMEKVLCTPSLSSERSGWFRGVFDTLKDIGTGRMSRPPFFSRRRRHILKPEAPKISFNVFLLFGLIFFIGLIDGASAAYPQTTTATTAFTMYAFNGNGMTGTIKLQQFSDAVRSRRPHAFVVSETKTNSKLRNSLPCYEYEIFEEAAEPSNNFHTYKWGMILGIRKDIQILQRVTTAQQSLKGRLIAVDLALLTLDGRAFTHRVIGAYAPWNPGGLNNEGLFWPALTDFCVNTTTSWSLAGDLNATVASFERKSGGQEARKLYLAFLEATGSHDLWSRNEDRNRLKDWTVRARSEGATSGNIIDRVVSSSDTLIDAEICVADRRDDFIQGSDHRPIIATMVYGLPPSINGTHQNLSEPSGRISSTIPRIRVPFKGEKHKYKNFSDEMDSRIKAEPDYSTAITNDDSFLRRYSRLSKDMSETAEKIFGRAKRYKPKTNNITNTKISGIVMSLRILGGTIRLEKSGADAQVSLKARQMHQSTHREYLHRESQHNDDISFLIYLQRRRRALYKSLYRERTLEIALRANQEDRRRIFDALRGGSTRKLFTQPFVPLPMVVNSLDDPDRLICDPQGVKAETRKYFENLYDHSNVPVMEKPWMTTPSVIEVRNRVLSDPFTWPQTATLADLRAMIRRGNARPSPGPDGWEKWIVKALSDEALQLVLELVNYMVKNSRFPGDVKDMWLTASHKKGLHTQLSNWRGLMLSNFLANVPMAWLNYSLISYASAKRILPDTQVAAQPGVQTRDLMSFLAGVKCWAYRNKETVFALKRDQMKGFDYLSPDGFYDAVNAYGLPSAISDLDRAAQTDTKCFIRTAYGVTEPIVVTGVTKQGGPLSPLKSTFTTSLGHYLVDDLVQNDDDALVITSASNKRGDPHFRAAKTTICVPMVEATDDSYLFSKSLKSLQMNVLAMERFQYAYGWQTQWKKTFAFLLNGSESDHADASSVTMQSVSIGRGVDPMVIQEHEVPLIHDELEFLRAKVNDPNSRFQEILALIDTFQFPRTVKRPPITLLRKVVAQNLTSRIRALLTLQPVKHADAEKLDHRVLERVHNMLGFPFRPNTSIATLPISLRGFDFPSISRINQAIAISGVSRDLNHHIPAYRAMAQITLADWMCEKNGCQSPIDDATQSENLKTFNTYLKQVPAEWIIARNAMRSFNPPLTLRNTDQSFLIDGEVSISHIINMGSHNHQQINQIFDGNALRSLRLKGLLTLKDIGTWSIDKRSGNIKMHFHQLTFDRTWSTSARNNWDKLKNAFEFIHLELIARGPTELLLERSRRKRKAEALLHALESVSKFPRSREVGDDVWASDGSMVPAAVGLTESKTVIGAATGPSTLALRVPGLNVSILHGELVGLITALVLSAKTDNTRNPNTTLLTDHLNSVRLINDNQSSINQEPRLRNMNGRSYYRWIMNLVQETQMSIKYTPGHSSSPTLEARMNEEADYYASSSQQIAYKLPIFSPPTFYMNEYTFFRDGDGFIESNISHFVDTYSAIFKARELSIGHGHRMTMSGFDETSPPTYPYLKAVSAHSAAVQLYARSGQLATADVLYSRGKASNKICPFGCEAIGNMHHLFVNCKEYTEWRSQAGLDLVVDTEKKLRGLLVNDEERKGVEDDLLHLAESIFSDDSPIWPLQKNVYYLGKHPSLSKCINETTVKNEILRKRVIFHISTDWHSRCIRLAGRIFGDYQRRMAVMNGCRKPVENLYLLTAGR